jgi:hypothetical protein
MWLQSETVVGRKLTAAVFFVSAHIKERRNMPKKISSYGPETDKLLAAWPSSKAPKKSINWGIDSGTAIIYIVILIIAPLIALTITFYNQRNERIDCSKLSSSSINYLVQGGEEVPLGCTLGK